MKNFQICFCILTSIYEICFSVALENPLIFDSWSKCERKCSERFGIQTKKKNASEKRYCYDGNISFNATWLK